MSKNIIILQHIDIETPGYILDLMKKDNFNLTAIELDEGEKIPSDIDQFDGMFCMGGPMDTWMEKDYPWLIDEKKKIEEFVVNFATSKTKKQMNLSSLNVPKDQDEFFISNLKKRKSKLVQAPSVAESSVNLECKLIKTIKLKSNNKKYTIMIVGEVIGIFIKDSFIKNDRVNSTAMRFVARMGYSEYTTVSSNFKMKRPK